MAESASASAKVCAACSKDVSNLPRTKDAQGRYFCKACVDKLKAKSAKGTAPANAQAVSGETDVMAKLLAETPGVELCPNCGGGINVGAKICVRCGFNKETGRAMKVVVERAKPDKDEPKAKRGPRFVLSEGMYLMILIALVGGGFTVSMFDPTFALLLYGICSILFLVAWVWGIVAAFMDDESVVGICGIVGFFIGLSWIYFVYWCIFGTWRGYLKMTMAGAIIGLIAGGISMYGHVSDDLDSPHTRSTQRGRAAPASAEDQDASDQSAPAKPENPTPSDGTVLGG